MRVYLLGVLLALSVITNAQQDQHFSMFSASPVYLNPATAGFAPGDLQLFTNYRLQWMTASDNPYRTFAASADWRMFEDINFLGAGLIFYNDVAGVSQYQTNVVSLPVNYTLQLDKDNRFSVGLQPAFYQRAIKNSQVTWDSQWNGVEFDPTLSSNESLLAQNFSVSRFDVSIGVFWESYLNKNAKIMLGAAGHHLTKQRVNFTNDDERLYRKLTIHGQGEFKSDYNNITIQPAFIAFLQGPNKELMAGSNFRFLLRGASKATSYFDEISLTLGSFFRVGDALMVNMMMDFSGFSFGAAYDLNVSRLNVATKGVGGMEFFLRYRFRFGTNDLKYNRVH